MNCLYHQICGESAIFEHPHVLRPSLKCASVVTVRRTSAALERLQQFFGEDRCHTVFDAAGFTPTRQLALQLVRSGGTIVLAGLGEADTTIDFVDVVRREVCLAGAYGHSRAEFQEAAKWIADGRLKTEGWLATVRSPTGLRPLRNWPSRTHHCHVVTLKDKRVNYELYLLAHCYFSKCGKGRRRGFMPPCACCYD